MAWGEKRSGSQTPFGRGYPRARPTLLPGATKPPWHRRLLFGSASWTELDWNERHRHSRTSAAIMYFAALAFLAGALYFTVSQLVLTIEWWLLVIFWVAGAGCVAIAIAFHRERLRMSRAGPNAGVPRAGAEDDASRSRSFFRSPLGVLLNWGFCAGIATLIVLSWDEGWWPNLIRMGLILAMGLIYAITRTWLLFQGKRSVDLGD